MLCNLWKENNIAIGAVELKLNGYTDMTQRDDECELGYWLGQPFGGKGYMPEAARESLRHGFEDLFCFLGAKSFMPGIEPPATAQKYRLATLQYGLNLRRYFSNSLRSIFCGDKPSACRAGLPDHQNSIHLDAAYKTTESFPRSRHQFPVKKIILLWLLRPIFPDSVNIKSSVLYFSGKIGNIPCLSEGNSQWL